VVSVLKGRVMWIKTPKCAGTSIKKCFEEVDLLYTVNASELESVDLESILAARMVCVRNVLKKLDARHPDVVASAWKFAVVRNPWDKFVSSWKYCKSTKHRPLKEVALDPPRKEDNVHDWHHLTRTQWDMLLNREGELRCDHFVHFESLQEDFEAVFARLGIPVLRFPFENRTKHRPYWTYYDDETREIVADLYRQDIEAFGYRFEESPERPLRRAAAVIQRLFSAS